ncbi:MAG: hypothetical protein KKG59_02030 [Nanoarchaeota archaeon]|nr:hypothetical protein [Nanoarchaeota archaeon]
MTTSFIYAIDVDNYLFDVRKVIRIALKNLDKIFYISLNRTAKNIKQFCIESDVDPKKIFILDMVSNRFRTPDPQEDVMYLDITSDPSNSLKQIVEALESHRCDTILFDSLSTLELYYDVKTLTKFVHDLLVYTQSENLISILLIQRSDVEKEWVKSILPLVDELKEVHFDQTQL